MNSTLFCGSCGIEILATAKFCRGCGADQNAFADDAPPPPAPPSEPAPQQGWTAPQSPGQAPGAGAFGRGASDFAAEVAGQVQTPGVLAALLSGAIAAGACLAAGILLAVAMPTSSVIGFGFADVGLVSEILGQTVGLLLVTFGGIQFSGVGRYMPLTLVAVPLLGSAVGAVTQAGRTAGLAPWARVGWGAATGLPLAFVMTVLALSAGSPDPSVGGAFILALLWGSIGGAVGAAWVVRRQSPGGLALPSQVPQPVRKAGTGIVAAGGPLLVAVALTAVIGAFVSIVQAIRVGGDGGYSKLTEIVDSLLFAVDHGVSYLALGLGSSFSAGPSPIGHVFPGTSEETFRIFDFSDPMEPYVFIPLLIALIAIPLMLLLYSGFATARAVKAPNQGLGAAWGLLVGPIWALALVTLNAMTPDIAGVPVGDSLFGVTLLAGAALGALGGVMGTSMAGDSTPVVSTPVVQQPPPPPPPTTDPT